MLMCQRYTELQLDTDLVLGGVNILISVFDLINANRYAVL